MKLVLDVQGFKIKNNKFIAKELAAFDGLKISHYIFKAPFPITYLPQDLHKQADWLMNNHHCINWSEGFTPLYQFGSILKHLTENVKCIYVKGKEKSEYIKKYSLAPVIEIEEQPALNRAEPSCLNHLKSPCVCALTNVYNLYNTFIME